MDSLVLAEEIIDQFDDEISGQEALEFVAAWSVSSTYTMSLTRTKILNAFNQKLKYFKTAQSSLHMDLLEAAEDIIDQVEGESSDD